MVWIKLLLGTLVVAATIALARPSGSHSVESRGFTVDGHQCLYRVADGRLDYLIVLDGEWLRGSDRSAGRSSNHDEEFEFTRADGRSFRMQFAGSGLSIDGREYQMRDGVVFLVAVGPGGNRCRQVPAAPRVSGIPYPDGEPQVRDHLEQLARDIPEVKAFLARN